MNLDIDLGLEWSAKQWLAINFRAPPHAGTGAPQIEIVGVLGEYGGGKTFSAAARFFQVCVENPFEHGVHSGDDPPMSIITAPTMADAKMTGPLRELRKLIGPASEDLIERERLYGEYQDLELVNGHRIILRSAGGALNGPSVCQLWADEIQEKVYKGKWDNLQGRVRDVRARRLNCQASGIAERGHVEEIFRLPRKHESGLPFCSTDAGAGNRLTVLLFPEDNEENLGAGYQDELKSSLPDSRKRDADGWLLPREIMFPSWSLDAHLRLPRGVKARRESDLHDVPTSLSIDLGRKAAVAWFQPVRVKLRRTQERTAILFVRQWMPDNLADAEKIALRVQRQNRFRLDKRHSVICLDPTTEVDQVRHFQRAFPGIRIVQHRRGFYHKEENGIRAVDRALLDQHRNVRLFVAPWLRKDPSGRGLVEMFGGYSALKPKDKKLEHASDVVRYATQHVCPLPMVSEPLSEENEGHLNRMRSRTAGIRVSDLG